MRILFWKYLASKFDRGPNGDLNLPKYMHWLYAAMYPIQSLACGYDPKTDTYLLHDVKWSSQFFYSMTRDETRYWIRVLPGKVNGTITLESRDMDRVEELLNMAVSNLDIIVAGRDWAGEEIDRDEFTKGLRDHLRAEWDKVSL